MPSPSPPAVAADSYNSCGIDNGRDAIDHMGTLAAASTAAAAASNCKQQFTSRVGTKQRRLVELYDVAGKVCDFILGYCAWLRASNLRQSPFVCFCEQPTTNLPQTLFAIKCSKKYKKFDESRSFCFSNN